jgi:hypothetical protein
VNNLNYGSEPRERERERERERDFAILEYYAKAILGIVLSFCVQLCMDPTQEEKGMAANCCLQRSNTSLICVCVDLSSKP